MRIEGWGGWVGGWERMRGVGKVGWEKRVWDGKEGCGMGGIVWYSVVSIPSRVAVRYSGNVVRVDYGRKRGKRGRERG